MLNTVIEVGIGLSILYTLLSLMCSAINELVASALALRARNLREGVENLIGKPKAAELYGHPLILSLYRDEMPTDSRLRKVFARFPKLRRLVERPPSYLPADKFTLALLQLTAPSAVSPAPTAAPGPGGGSVPAGAPPAVAECVTGELASLEDDRLRSALQTLWLNAGNDVAAFVKSVESWFNNGMDRVAGWYKRKTQWMLLGLGLGIAVVLNVNTIGISQRLWASAPLRTAVVEQSKKLPPPTTTPDGSFGDAIEDVQESFKDVSDLQLPMGWAEGQRPSSPVIAALGWLLTAAALSLGAPFWFDLLGRVAALRNTGSPEKTPAKKTGPASARG